MKENLSKKAKMKICRIYSHYETWEDFQNGMYEELNDENTFVRINESIILLSTPILLYDAMNEVINKWVNATEFNLSNKSCNRRAWLGQSACNIKINATESEVRKAWNTISEIERIIANNVADCIIYDWEKQYLEVQNEKVFK